MSEVITHWREGEDFSYKLCQCQRCGLVSECTPDQWFMVSHDDAIANPPGGAPLYCENCLYIVAGAEDLPRIDMELPPGPYVVGDLIEGKKDGRRMVIKVTGTNDEGGLASFEVVG